MYLLWSLFIAISPAIALLCYFYEQDNSQGKSHSAKIKVFLLGITSIIPAFILEEMGDYLLNYGKFTHYLSQYFTLYGSPALPLTDALLMGFLWTAGIEKSIKFIYILVLSRQLREFDTKKNIIIYTVILALGFATLENILYVFSLQKSGYPILSIALTRAFMSLPMHVISAVAMGFFVGKAKFSDSRSRHFLVFKAWISAILIHGTYNTLLFLNSPFKNLLALFLILMGIYISIRIIITLSKEDNVISNRKKDTQNQPASTRAKPSLIEAAKQGNPKAIAKLINRSLQFKGTSAKVTLNRDCLQVMLESSQVPAINLVRILRQGLITLGVDSIKQVKVYGRQLGEEIPDWSHDFELPISTPSISSGVSPSPSLDKNKISELKSQKQKLSRLIGTKGKSLIFIAIITATVVACLGYSVLEIIKIIGIFNSSNSNPTSLSQSNLPSLESKQDEPELTAAEKAIQANPNNHQAWYSKGQALFNLERHQEALAAYDKALQINPNYIQAWSERSLVLRILGRFDEALISAEKAIQINPNFADGWKNRCGALMTLQRNQEALTACDKAIQLKPDYSQAWYNRALVLKNLRRYEEAVASYDKVVQLHPDYYTVWYERGIILYDLQRYEEALACYNKAIQIYPNYAEAWYERGLTLEKLGRDEEALKSYNQALQIEFSPQVEMAKEKLLRKLRK